MIKNDIWIKWQASQGMITPFEPRLIREVDKEKVISYGLSSYGYDIRLSPKEFKIFRHIPGTVIDPKNFNPENLEQTKLHEDSSGHYFILPAHSYGLGIALERIQMPPNITALAIGKSTYCLSVELLRICLRSKVSGMDISLWSFPTHPVLIVGFMLSEGVVQLLFFEGEPCQTTYEARNGKYQNQPEQVITARV